MLVFAGIYHDPHSVQAVQLDEQALVLEFLFTCKFRTPNYDHGQVPLDLAFLRHVLVAGDKYDIHQAHELVNIFLGDNWSSFAFNPLLLYAFVHEHGFDEFCSKAYQETLTLNIDDPIVSTAVDRTLTAHTASALRSQMGHGFNVGSNRVRTRDSTRHRRPYLSLWHDLRRSALYTVSRFLQSGLQPRAGKAFRRLLMEERVLEGRG